jgi:hypothetical protein
MKEEKEVIWLCKLLISRFAKSVGRNSGCKKDYERAVEASDNDKTFRQFMQKMIEYGAIEFLEKKVAHGGYLNYYVVNKTVMKKCLRENKYYRELREYFLSEETALGLGY